VDTEGDTSPTRLLAQDIWKTGTAWIPVTNEKQMDLTASASERSHSVDGNIVALVRCQPRGQQDNLSVRRKAQFVTEFPPGGTKSALVVISTSRRRHPIMNHIHTPRVNTEA
jgi:hypothetical protein